jgi:AAA15 family ATPase/GTPase
MLVRFVAKNAFSFKEETEFNLFPNKTQRLSHHKISHDDIEVLRLSAIYGANGSGKSNLIKSISLLEEMVDEGKLKRNGDNIKFALSEENLNLPVSFAIEFWANSKFYYYTLTYDNNIILNEFLAESKKEKDILIFDRNFEDGVQKITFYEGYMDDEKNKLFVDVLAEKLIQKDELLLSFLNTKYKDDFADVKNAFDWFNQTLVIIKPNVKPGGIAHLLDSNSNLKKFADKLIPGLNTGISKIEILKNKLEEFVDSSDRKTINGIIADLKDKSYPVSTWNSETGEETSFVYENDEVLIKRLVTKHVNDKGKDVDFFIGMESDGTRRLIDYMPALAGIVNNEEVYLIDEIERSIHPIIIKEIISKISLDTSAKGQLIFTTHESCLLDQEILRPDEIWFAQKDVNGASKLYSLSDFNIHNTANIENGYLNGRYGGIPFLSNLQDLNWHKY